MERAEAGSNTGPDGGAPAAAAGQAAAALSEKARGKLPEGSREDAAVAPATDDGHESPSVSRRPSSSGPATASRTASDGRQRLSPAARWSSSTLVNLLEMAELSSAPHLSSTMPSSPVPRRRASAGPSTRTTPQQPAVAGPSSLAGPGASPVLHEIDHPDQRRELPVLVDASVNTHIEYFVQTSESDEVGYSDEEEEEEEEDDGDDSHSPWSSARPRHHVRPVTAFSLSLGTSEVSMHESTAYRRRRRRHHGDNQLVGGGDEDWPAARATTDKQVCGALLHRWEAECRRFGMAARGAGADVRAVDPAAARRLDEANESLELFRCEIAQFCHMFVDGFIDEGWGVFATPAEWAAREEKWLRWRAGPGQEEDVSAELERRKKALDWEAREWARPPDDCDEEDDPPGGRSRFLSIGEWVREQDRVLAAGAYVDVQSRWCQEPRQPRQVVRKTRDVGEATQSVEQEEEEEDEEEEEEQEEDLYGCDDDEMSPAAVAEEPGPPAARKDKRDGSAAEQEHDISTKPTARTTPNSAGLSTLPTTTADDGPAPDSLNAKPPAPTSNSHDQKPAEPTVSAPRLVPDGASGQTHPQPAAEDTPLPASATKNTEDNNTSPSPHRRQASSPPPHTSPVNPPPTAVAPAAAAPPASPTHPAAAAADGSEPSCTFSSSSSSVAGVAIANPAQIQAVIGSLERALAAVAATTSALEQDHGSRQLAAARRRSQPAYRRAVAPVTAAHAALLRADVSHALRIRDAMAAESARLRRVAFLDSTHDLLLLAAVARESWWSSAPQRHDHDHDHDHDKEDKDKDHYAAATSDRYCHYCMSGAIRPIPLLLVDRGEDDDDARNDGDRHRHEPGNNERGGKGAAAATEAGMARRVRGWIRNRLLRHESRVVAALGRHARPARRWAETRLTALETRLDRHLRDISARDEQHQQQQQKYQQKPLGDLEAVAELLGMVQRRARRLRSRDNEGPTLPKVRLNVLGRL